MSQTMARFGVNHLELSSSWSPQRPIYRREPLSRLAGGGRPASTMTLTAEGIKALAIPMLFIAPLGLTRSI